MGFRAESSQASLLLGIEFAASPYWINDNPQDRGALDNSLWSVVMSRWSVNVTGEILDEAERASCGDESGDVDRFWWLPGALLLGLRDFGPLYLCGADWMRAGRQADFLDAISRVRWSIVDDRGCDAILLAHKYCTDVSRAET